MSDLKERNASEDLDLTDGMKLHTVVGIALSSVLIPGVKDYVNNKLSDHYNDLVNKYNINTEAIQ